MSIFFVGKNVRSFCSAKASLIFPTKNISVSDYEVVKHLGEVSFQLTVDLLTSSLS